MALRELSCRKLFGPHFLAVVLFIAFSYYLFVGQYMLRLRPQWWPAGVAIFHVALFMLLWSMVRAIVSDPGRVPIYWGFFLDEKETKKRRYCLLCHSFKPERCHHCATCQRCVLNMDHHCPWISNCVGFMNRKFFMLFLTYIILTIVVAVGFMTPLLVQELMRIVHDPKYALDHPMVIVRLLGFAVLVTFGGVISVFYKFHMDLVLQNSSTLDNLDKARNPEQAQAKNIYDVGSYENWLQVFGNNVWLWPFPVFGESGKPRGDGVEWKKNE